MSLWHRILSKLHKSREARADRGKELDEPPPPAYERARSGEVECEGLTEVMAPPPAQNVDDRAGPFVHHTLEEQMEKEGREMGV